jgi:membrane-bound ClpP family serine protease
VIRASILRLLLAGGVCLLSFAFYSPGGDNTLAVVLLCAGALWGLVELFILSALLFTYGVSGFIHGIGAINQHDPWHRW